MGTITGGSAETLNPALAGAVPDIARISQLYDRLFTPSEDLKSLRPALAVAAEGSPDATKWVLHLRDGVTWHDGRPFTAADVAYTIRGWGDSGNFNNYGEMRPVIDFAGVRSRGRLTVEVPLRFGVADFPSLLAYPYQSIIQDGTSVTQFKTRPVGTGPFKYRAFTPGSQSTFFANHDYWDHGKPYVDQLVINSSFSDETARQNALLSGAVQASGAIPPLLAKQIASSGSLALLRSNSNAANWMCMRVDRPPFNDVRVRQAMRYIADRPALIEGALGGFGTVGNDLQGDLTRYFATDLKRSQDLERARSLLKAAGRENMTVTLQVAPAAPGFVSAATLFASQARSAGVTVVVQQTPAASYYTPAGGYLSRNFGFDELVGAAPSLAYVYLILHWTGAPFNDEHFGSPATDKLLFKAIASRDPNEVETRWREVQLQQFEQGGSLVFANADYLDAIGPSVHGLRTTPVGNFNGWRFLDGWITE